MVSLQAIFLFFYFSIFLFFYFSIDPLSPSIFILFIEILFIQIRSDSSIKGFQFNNIEIKLTAFADDATILVKDVQSLKRILNVSKSFEVFSFP